MIEKAQFTPGQSGNPEGRPKSPRTILQHALAKRLAEPLPEKMIELYRRVDGAEVGTVADAIALESTRLITDAPPPLDALASLLQAVSGGV